MIIPCISTMGMIYLPFITLGLLCSLEEPSPDLPGARIFLLVFGIAAEVYRTYMSVTTHSFVWYTYMRIHLSHAYICIHHRIKMDTKH